MMKISDEEWLPVVGYEATYAVSSMGRVCSWPRPGRWQGGLMKPGISRLGYPMLSLHQGGRRRTTVIHILVAAAFLGPRPSGLEVRHLDGDSTNSDVRNLRYGTKFENAQDRIRHGRHENVNKTHCLRGHPYDETNTRWSLNRRHRTCRACAREWARVRRLRIKMAAT